MRLILETLRYILNAYTLLIRCSWKTRYPVEGPRKRKCFHVMTSLTLERIGTIDSEEALVQFHATAIYRFWLIYLNDLENSRTGTRTRKWFITLKYILQYKSTIEMIYQWKTTLECITLSTDFWTLIICHVWRPFYDEYTSLSKGHNKNQGFNITIIMLVNATWCTSNIFFLFH